MGCGERPAAGCGLRGGRLRGAGCGAADVSSLDFFAACSHAASDPNKVAKNSQRSSSTRRPLRLVNCSRGRGHAAGPRHHRPAQRGGARCGSDGVVLRAKPGGRERAEPRGSEGPRRGRSERPAETRWASPSDHAHRLKGIKRSAKPAAGRQMSRRWTFSPHTRAELRAPTKWRKTRNTPRAPAVPSASARGHDASSDTQATARRCVINDTATRVINPSGIVTRPG